jgi:hypothetical protein
MPDRTRAVYARLCLADTARSHAEMSALPVCGFLCVAEPCWPSEHQPMQVDQLKSRGSRPVISKASSGLPNELAKPALSLL